MLAAWIPLALSFELMVMEGPVLQGAIGRLGGSEVNLAAWGLTMSLAMLVESPVILLLATSIALVRNRDSFRALWNFMVGLNLVCTVLAAILAYTPLLDIVAGQWMGQPPELIEASRPALKIMILFTALVGWRRFYQGVLIRAGKNRLVTLGTAVRLVALAGVAVLLAKTGTLPGVEVAAWGLMAGLLVEGAITTVFTLPVIRNLPPRLEDTPPLTQRSIMRFHTPLAATTLLPLLAGPLTMTALAQMPDKQQTLAAWPVVFMILLILRGFGLTLQEVTVAHLKDDPRAEAALYRFAVWVGAITTGIVFLVALTPLLRLYMNDVLNSPHSLWGYIREGVLWGAAAPLLTALSAWARGGHVAHGRTALVYQAMMVSLVVQAVLLVLGIVLHLPGMPAASFAFTGALLAEYLYLVRHQKSLSPATPVTAE
ncbi:MAG: hypothetical protein OHK0029_17800 [Armatimonadaceae bacterium]